MTLRTLRTAVGLLLIVLATTVALHPSTSTAQRESHASLGVRGTDWAVDPSPSGSPSLPRRTTPTPASRSRTSAPRPARPSQGTPTPADATGSLDWRALADCESSGDPTQVSRSGRYRGLYQFDLETWRSVGGIGDPAAASAAEQTHRAQLLYAERGRAPWPVCGRRL